MMHFLKRIMCKYVFSYHLWRRNCSQKFLELPSALYIGLNHKAKVFSALDPHIDVIYTFKDITKLKSDLQQRNMNVDVDYLHLEGLKYEKLKELIAVTKKRKKDLNWQLRSLSSNENESSVKEDIPSLEKELEEATFTLKSANKELLLMENSFIIPYLKLPNSLHKNTTEYDENLFSMFHKPEFTFPVKSHIEIGRKNDELEFKDVSPTAYYLKNNLALVEMAVNDFLMTRFREHDFKNYANIDLVRAVLAEGCGFDINSNNKFLRVEDQDCLSSNLTQYLFGGSSLPSFVALFCKAIVTFDNELPVRMVASGRKYDLVDVDETSSTNSLFNSLQSTSVSSFVVYPSEVVDEAMVNEIAMLLNQTYTELGLHYHLIQYGAAQLKSYESLAVGVCMYSPYCKKYIEIGRISLCQDFISKRLQIFQSVGKKRVSFLNMIYVEIMDIKKWIGCMLENTQTQDGNYKIPDCLKPFMYTL